MAIITRSKKKSNSCNHLLKAVAGVAFATIIAMTLVGHNPTYDKNAESFWGASKSAAFSSNVDYQVDAKCTSLPSIRPSGSYFLDDRIKGGSSSENISPAFKVGSYYADKVPYHMATDTANFHLIKDLLKGKESGLVLDIGANQGFYTYYLASLGMDVHSFEIYEPNFRALQHGAEFNPKDVADRVDLYPVGLGEKNSRFSMQGSNYEGFLKEGKGGPILGVTFDCFAHHMRGKLDISNVAFIKLDVEGFEIAVLKGAQNSLFKHGYSKIGGMVMEVGPDRWGWASSDFATGVDEMKKLSTHFKASHVLIRSKGGFTKSCPLSLSEDVLSDKKPLDFDGVSMFTVKIDEWEPLLAKMEKNHYDCNFFYKN